MKTKFKRLTREPQYNLLKNINFRNNQNYIKTNNAFLNYNENIDKYENSLTVKIYWIFLLIFSALIFLWTIIENKIFILIYILIIPIFKFITNFKQYLMNWNRKRKYILIKIIHNKNYFIILNKIWWKIVKKINNYENKI